MYAKYLEHLAAAGKRVEAPALRGIYCGGAPLSPSVKAAVESAFGLPLNNGYGLTEAAPTITQARSDEPRTDCSVGPPCPAWSCASWTPKARDARRARSASSGCADPT